MKKHNLLGKSFLSSILSAGMILSLLPSNFALAADTGITLYAAAYQNADELSETTLPSTIQINGSEEAVTWYLRSSKFAVPYETVMITGNTTNGDTVNAKVEVIPEAGNPLVYFVDASRDSGKESKAFNAVHELTGTTLKNQVADQPFNAASQWGRNNNNFSEKNPSNLDVSDKYQTGWYSSSKTSPLQYQFYLEAGDYTLNAGFREWWNNRSMKVAISGSNVTPVTSGAVAVSGAGNNNTTSLNFTVNEAGLVTMQIQNATNGEAPVISWFAIAKGAVTTPNVKPETEIIINGADVDAAAANVNGLTWKGYGLLSGNSTSDLLMDYKTESPETYQEMLNVLFGGEHPLLTHVKVEMGNDGNNSTGADSCTMRFEDEEADASRSPGFQLAADAKKVNPAVKVSFLRWEMPAWVQSAWNSDKTGSGYEAMYKWYKETIFDAYEKYGYVVDYVDPDKNETTNVDTSFIKWFRNRVSNETVFPDYMDEAAQNAYHNIKIIASDENTSLNIVPAMRNDSTLYNAVDAVGFHYSTGTQSSTADYRTMADKDDKEVWYSEGCATFSYSEYQENKNSEYGGNTIGGYQSPLALVDNVIASFVYSRKSHYIFQPAIGSFYEGAQYDHKEIMSAREPWAGYVHYDPVIYMLQHFTKFAKTGWENNDNTADIWRIIANATGNTSGNKGDLGHLQNPNGNPSYMTLAAPDKSAFSVVLVNNSDATLPYAVKATNLNLPEGAAAKIWETKTDSYMKYAGEADYANGYYNVTVEPFSIVTLTTLDCDTEEYTSRLPESKVKTVLDTDSTGAAADTTDKILYADDFEYADYAEDYLEKRGNEPRYAVDFTGAFVVEDGKLKQLLPTSVGQWNNNEPNTVIGDFHWMNYKASTDVTVASNSYAGLNIRQQTGMGFEGSGYNLRITGDGNWTLKKRNTTIASGQTAKNENNTYSLALEGRDSFITAWVDGHIVATYCDPNPEYFGRVRLGCGWTTASFDNLKVETIDDYVPYATSLIDSADDAVSYEGKWDIIAGAGGSNNDWYRSTSTTQTAGSSFSFQTNGGGFALIGVNDGTAVLDVEVDGTKAAADAATNTSSNHCATYMLEGLTDALHDVKVTVTSGKLVLDAIHTLPYSAVDPAERIVSAETVYGAAFEGEAPVLPSTITLHKANGETVTEEVTWDSEGFSGKAYETALATGITKTTGTPVSAKVEMAPSKETPLVYFVDAGRDAGTTSVAFDLISSLTGDTLKNTVADQAYSAETGWGRNASVFHTKTPSAADDVTDKYQTGHYSNTKTDWLVYDFTLEPGVYELTGGLHEWWNNRSTKLSVSGAHTETATSRVLSVSTSGNRNDSASVRFTVTENDTVRLEVQNATGGEAPVINWIGIAKAEDYFIPADKTELSATIESLKAITGDIYTTDSFAAFASALENAQNVAADPKATQEAVNGANTALINAHKALKIFVDKSELNAAIEFFKDITGENYTADSFAAFASALENAQNVAANADASQEDVNAANTALSDAYKALEIFVDKSELNATIESLKDITGDIYTTDSFAAFASALENAQSVLADEEATMEDIKNTAIALLDAYLSLKTLPPVVTVSKTELNTTIELLKDLSGETYTVDSFAAFTSALENAQNVAANADASQEDVNAAKVALLKAYSALEVLPPVIVVDKSELNTVIDSFKDITGETYTTDSFAVFASALTAAQNALTNPEASQEDVDAAIDALKKAYADLAKVSESKPESKPEQKPDPKPEPQPEAKTQLSAPVIASLKSSLTKSGSLVTIKVTAVEHADSYTVYRKAGNKVTTVGVTTTDTVKDLKPVSGKKASYYAVAASANTEKYTASTNGTAKTITLAKNSRKVTAKKSNGKVKIKISKAASVKGYVIYRSSKKNGTYKKLTKKPIRKLTYIDKTVKTKKTYYYKVVSYGKNKTYSAGKISNKVTVK